MSGYDFDRDYLPRILGGSRSGLTESARPKSKTFLDEVRQDARDIWSDSAIDRYGKGKHSKHHYSKKRPISADSSASSVSSISDFHEEPSEDSFKLDLSELLDSKKETSGYRPYRSNHEDFAISTWPHPPKYNHSEDMLKKSADLARSLPMDVSKLDMNDKDFLDTQRKKLSSLGQERDSLSLQASHYRQSAENAASDLAAEKVKNQTLAEDIKKGRAKMSDMQQKIMDLKCEIESGKQLQARTSAMLSSLQHRVKDAEDFAADKENKMSRVDVTVLSLKKELQRQIDERQKVEISLKHHLSVGEENSKRAGGWERKLREMCALLANVLGIDAPGSLEASDLIISRVKEAVRDFDSLQKQMHSVTHQFQNSDLEVKASRETIMRLVADVGKEQKVAGERLKEIEEVKRERDIAKQNVREAELELQQVKDTLKHSQEAWNQTRERLTEQDMKLHKYDKVLHSKEESYHKADIKLKHFKRQLSEMLTFGDDSVSEREEDILQRVRKMHQSYKEKKSSQEKLKSRVSALAEELTNQRNVQHTALARAGEAENHCENMIERTKALEGELIAADVERDRLKDDRNKFMAFIDKLSRAMKLDEVAVEGGFDINSDAILLRAEQLSKSETNSLQDRTSTIYSLQRKSKTLKQQLESRDFQLSLSKKKMSELEEILKDRSRIENERDDTTIKHQKLQKKCERLQDELNKHKDIVTQLKAKIMEYGEQQIKIEEQKRVIEDLESLVNRLAKSKHKTDRQLAVKREALKSTSKQKEEEISKTNNIYQQLEKELQLTKAALEEAQNRERQLVKFRQALAGLIGLEIEDLSVPDYEIIAKLEKIVRGYSSYTDTVKTLESTLSTMEQDFRHGYTGVQNILHAP